MRTKADNPRISPSKRKAKSMTGCVPRLRFPEFREMGEWDKAQLSSRTDINPTRKKLDDELLVSFVPMALVSEEGFLIGFHIKKYSEVKQGFPSFQDHDILIAKITPCYENGKSALVSGMINGAGFGSTEFIVIRVHEGIYPAFLFKYITTDQVNKLGRSHMTGSGGQQRVPHTFFSNLLLSFPLLPEQRKIAACLSSLDEIIAAHNKKLEALKKYKMGLMQVLFPAEGEKVPRLRFPEFRDTGEWENKKASTMFFERIENGATGLPMYSVTIDDGMIKRSLFDRNFFDIKDPKGNKKVWKNDIAYNMMRMWQGALGVAVEDCMVSPAYVVLKPADDTCSMFYFFLLKTKKYLQQLTSHSQGLTLDRLRLYYKNFSEILIPYPSLPEQRKIAASLSSLDDLIAAQAKQIATLKEHKQGLMQGLFPRAGEED